LKIASDKNERKKNMSTPNFYKKNASKYFANEIENDFDFDDLTDNVRSEIKNAEPVDRWEKDGLRSYEGKIFAEINKTIGKWIITIELIARGGYYGGANLDWNVEIVDNNSGYDFGWNDEKISGTADYYINKQIEKIEKVYSEYTTPLICVGVFSNGEAVYEKLKAIAI